MRAYRYLAAASLAVVAALAGVGPAAADDGSGAPNNYVISRATAEHPVVQRSRVVTAAYGGPTANSQNVAYAEGRDCTGCRSVAVAFQAVFLTGNPSTVNPTNVAAAYNYKCTGCTTFAWAYQYVLTTQGQFELSGAARQQIASIREQAEQVAESGAPPADMATRLRNLEAQFKQAIDSALANSGEHGTGEATEREDIQSS